MPEHDPSPELPQPRHLDEAEALVGPFFADPVQAHQLYYGDINEIDPAEVFLREPTYVACLRIMATERHLARATLPPQTKESIATWNEQFEDELTELKLAAYRDKYSQQIAQLVTRLNEINGVDPLAVQEKVVTEATEDTAAKGPRLPEIPEVVEIPPKESLHEGLHDHQRLYVTGISDFLSEPPKTIRVINAQGKQASHQVKGAIVLGPTGIGKSVFMAKAAYAAEIGQLSRLHNGRTNRMLIVTPSQALSDQLAGIVGDDTFRRFAPPGLRVSVIDSRTKHKDLTADVVITSIEQFTRNTMSGRFCGQVFELLCIDEVQRLTAPLFRRAFLEQWREPKGRNTHRPIPTIGFTARADYNSAKDARALLPSIIEDKDNSTATYMEKGILGGGQFFTLLAEPAYDSYEGQSVDGRSISSTEAKALRTETLAQAAVDVVMPLLEQGRRGIIFCEAGGEAENAIDLAGRFHGTRLSNGTEIVAKALHSFGAQNDTRRTMEEYHAGKAHLLTSVGTGEAGLNADLGFVIILGNVRSIVRMTQITGRGIGSGLRKSEEFPTTVFAHIIAGHMGRHPRTFTFADALGLDSLGQGAVIGQGQAAAQPPSRIRADREKLMRKHDFPEKVQVMINRINYRTTQELRMAWPEEEKGEIPADYIPFDVIYTASELEGKIDRGSARRRLDRSGYASQGEIIRGETRKDDKLVIYYEPSAETFFTEKPVAPQATPEMKNTAQAARHLGVATSYVETLNAQMEAETALRRELRMTEQGRTFYHYGEDALAWMAGQIARMPTVDTGKTPDGRIKEPTEKQLALELGVNPSVITRHTKNRKDLQPTYKRLVDDEGKGIGFRLVFNEVQVAKIEGLTGAYPWADPDQEWSIARIAEEAGVSQPTAHKFLEDGDNAAKEKRRTQTKSGQTRELDHLPVDRAKAVVKRIKEHGEPLPASLLPYPIATRITHAPKKGVPSTIRSKSTTIQLPLQRVASAVTWLGLQKLADLYGWQEQPQDQTVEIDFSRLPMDDNPTLEQIIYARSVQLRFMSPKKMGNPDGIID